MSSIYTSGDYLAATQTWHTEDSAWKAKQIMQIIRSNNLHPASIGEVGCGAGGVLRELARQNSLDGMQLRGYDISPQAIELCRTAEAESCQFFCEDLLADSNSDFFDILLIIDVFEHVSDYLGFLRRCKRKAEYKIYHIPLDIHVSSVLRNAFMRTRYSVGHLHYFTAESAIASLEDTDHEIVDYFYTDAAFGTFKHHASIRQAVANGPRWLLSRLSVPFAARVLGGFSLLVLAR